MKFPLSLARPDLEPEPEAFALRWIRWQLFCVLTFRSDVPFESSRKKLLVSWLREFEKVLLHVNYRRILAISRFELGSRLQRGHLHVCLAGLPQDLISEALPHSVGQWWRRLSGGIAFIQLYDPSRGGLGYVLKRPVVHQHKNRSCDRPHPHVRWDELMPTLSEALLKATRRNRYVREGAPRT